MNWQKLASVCDFILYAGISQLMGVDARVNPADDPCLSYKNLVNFGPVTLSFAGTLVLGSLHAGLYHTFWFEIYTAYNLLSEIYCNTVLALFITLLCNTHLYV